MSGTTDSLPFQAGTIETNPADVQQGPQIATKEFLDLVTFIDSCGYKSDTLRAGKTYEHHDPSQIKAVKDYFFYNVKLKDTPPYRTRDFLFRRAENINSEDTINQQRMDEWRERWEMNYSLLEKVQRIIAYFYVIKQPIAGNGLKTYIDGIIEEWTFPDSVSAKNAAEDLAEKETMVYVNRGAYVCYLENYVYVFHSRSAGFYTPLKKFRDYFAAKNKAIIPNTKGQRQGY